jgi:hypothetical protein
MELVENLAEHEDVDEDEIQEDEHEEEEEREPPRRRRAANSKPLPSPEIRPGRVLCAGARGNLDDAAAVMLADVLRREDVPVTTVPHRTMQPAALRDFDFRGVGTVVVGYLNSESLAHARYLVRRLRRANPEITILIAFWALAGEDERMREVTEAVRADGVAASVDELAEWLEPAAERDEEEAVLEMETAPGAGLPEPAPAL